MRSACTGVRVLQTEQSANFVPARTVERRLQPLAVNAPGSVIAYEVNEQNNDMLEANGIEVLRIRATTAGGAAARADECPIERDAA